MREEQLQFIWANRLFDRLILEGQEVDVLDVGQQNSHDGPDFLMARIWKDDLEWIGAVEIHQKSSMWNQHGHDKDPRYNSVIMHVVLEHDAEAKNMEGRVIPTAVIEVDEEIVQGLEKLNLQTKALRCMPELAEVERERVWNIFSQLLSQRIDLKLMRAGERSSDAHVNSIFYQTLMRYMGAHQNNEVMEMVATSLPYIYLKKHADDLVALEAMLLGQAGLISEQPRDEYEMKLLKEYKFYQEKFTLTPIDNRLMSYLRLRPSSFPSRMLGIVAQIIHHENEVMSAISRLDKLEILRLLSLAPSDYWQNHIAFGHPLKRKMGGVGAQTLQSLIINVIIPTACYYANQSGDKSLAFGAIDWLRMLSPEQNQYIKIFKANGLTPRNAADTQAMLELYHSYCLPFRCLICPMASEIFSHLKKNPSR